MNDAKKLLADMKALGIKEGETIFGARIDEGVGDKGDAGDGARHVAGRRLGDDGHAFAARADV